jgi:hypothetical protein
MFARRTETGGPAEHSHRTSAFRLRSCNEFGDPQALFRT